MTNKELASKRDKNNTSKNKELHKYATPPQRHHITKTCKVFSD